MAVFHRKSRREKHAGVSLPRLWLFTDTRIADATLLSALTMLPRGSGVVFRHYDAPEHKRRALYRNIRAVARRRRLVLVLAGPAKQAQGWRANGMHISGARPRTEGRGQPTLIRSASAHSMREVIAANRGTVDLLFISPLFATRSHPGARALGPARFATLARKAAMPVIALGGMTAARFRATRALGAYGWAAIDALTRDKR